MKEYLITLLQYTNWANNALFKGINDEIADKETPSSFNTIRKTIQHIRDAQEIWFLRLSNESVTEWPGKGFNGSLADSIMLLEQNLLMWEDHIQARTEDELKQLVSYKNLKGIPSVNTLDQIVIHICNHCTYHRGQVVTMLRSLGITEVPQTDMSVFYRLPKTEI